MAATFPPIFTDVLDVEINVEGPVSEEVIRKMAQNCNSLSLLCPVGMVVGAAINIPGCPNVDSNLYQYCDGTEITNATSPLKSDNITHYFTVNMQGVFVRGALLESANNFVGNVSVDISHDHGGATGGHTEFLDPQSGSDWAGGDQTHAHAISLDLVNANPDFSTGDNTTTLDPLHYNVAFFIKIN